MNENIDKITALYDLPFMDLLYQAHCIHRQNFDPNVIQTSALLSIKTGNCPEDCAYCAQSRHYQTKIDSHNLMPLPEVIAKAKIAKQHRATRFCMSTAWSKPAEKEFVKIIEIIKQIKTLGLETCITLGKLNDEQVQQLEAAGLDYYNHNIDSSPEFYSKIVTTHTYQDRLETLHRIAKANIKICCGGIIGMGESRNDRIAMLAQLANLPKHPESVPINRLVPIKGTPLENAPALDDFEFIRTVAVARIMLPKSYIRLAAGRATMNDVMQACCFFAGANSIFYGDKLLTTANPEIAKDIDLFRRLGIQHA